MRTTLWGLIAVSALALTACDVVRVPGGDQQNEPRPTIPEGAPGPPPPTEPVADPWGENEETDPIEVPVNETDDVDNTDEPETPITEPESPTTDLEPVTDPGEIITDTPIDAEEPVDGPGPIDDGLDEEPAPVDPPAPLPVKFEYFASGDLIPGTGTGRIDQTVYAPDMVFPIKSAPTWPQSMVYRLGGAVGGDQCDPANYDIPWRDNFCEKRSSTRNTPMCPTNKVHQGQDIRVGSATDCNALRAQAKVDRGLHEVVAVEDGIIQHIGTYSVQLKGTGTGNLYSYLHLNMRRLRVSAMDTISAGDTIGFVSNDFGSTPTTFHLHFEIKAPVEGEGIVHVPPYMSLVAAYERREEGIGEVVEDDTIGIASLPVIVDESKLIE
ncbi:MAG: M23 family metallopeptidase [Pseudomonadota bacterium]